MANKARAEESWIRMDHPLDCRKQDSAGEEQNHVVKKEADERVQRLWKKRGTGRWSLNPRGYSPTGGVQ